MLDPAFFVVMAIAVVILGLSKGGFAGIGMVSLPLVASMGDPLAAAGMLLPIMIIQDLAAMWLHRRSFDIGILVKLIPGGIVGVIMAYLFAANVADWAVKMLLGSVSFAFSLSQLKEHYLPVAYRQAGGRRDWIFGFLAGVSSGFTSSVAHAGTPPFQIYAMPKCLPKQVYVGTSVMFFAALNAMKLPSYLALDLVDASTLTISFIFIPLALFASWAGARLVGIVDPTRFRVMMAFILMIIGLMLIGQAIANLSIPIGTVRNFVCELAAAH